MEPVAAIAAPPARLGRAAPPARPQAAGHGTGDFVDDHAVDSELRNDPSALFRATIRPPQVVGLEAIPVAIDPMRVNAARGTSRAKFLRHLTTRCSETGIGIAQRETGPVSTIAPAAPRETSRPF
ncbi:MAG: hypothetical protein ACM3SU_05730 [Acidobacteriota bacterium]